MKIKYYADHIILSSEISAEQEYLKSIYNDMKLEGPNFSYELREDRTCDTYGNYSRVGYSLIVGFGK